MQDNMLSCPWHHFSRSGINRRAVQALQSELQMDPESVRAMGLGVGQAVNLDSET